MNISFFFQMKDLMSISMIKNHESKALTAQSIML
jgi:hypothetical protein